MTALQERLGGLQKRTVCGMGEVGISASQHSDLLPTERVLQSKTPERRNRAYTDVFTACLRCSRPCRLALHMVGLRHKNLSQPPGFNLILIPGFKQKRKRRC